MDKSMWQTLGTFDLLYSSHVWIQSILSCEKHSTTLQIRIVSRLWFCRRPWKLEVNIRWTFVYFRKSHVRTNLLDVQETDFSFKLFYRSWGNFSRCRFTHGLDSRSRFVGFSDWSISFLTKPNQQNQRCKKARRKVSVAKSRSTAMNLSSHVPTSSSSTKSPIASKSTEILIGTEKPESRMRRHSKSDAASSSQAQLQDAYLGGLMDTATWKPVATKEESGDVDLSESETGSEGDVTGRPVAYKTALVKPYTFSESDCQGGPESERDRMVTQSTPVSSQNPPCGSSILDRQEDLRTRTWRPYGWFGREYGCLGHVSEYHSSSNSSSWTRQRGEFTIREKVFGTAWDSYSMKLENWSVNKKKSLVLAQRVSKMLRGCRQPYCEKRLCGSPTPKPTSSPTLCSVWQKWEMIHCDKREIQWYSEDNHFKEMNRIDGMPTEFMWFKV